MKSCEFGEKKAVTDILKIVYCFIQQCKLNVIPLRTEIICCTLHISVLCGPDDGRVTTETYCPNEFI